MYVSAIDAKYNSIIASVVFSYNVVQAQMFRISQKEGGLHIHRSCWDVNKQVYLRKKSPENRYLAQYGIFSKINMFQCSRYVIHIVLLRQ